MREFEYDISNSQSNEEKHGVSFEVAQSLWSDPDAVTFGPLTEVKSGTY